MRMTVQGSFAEWLRSVSPPPLKIDKGMMTSMSPGLIEKEERRDRNVIDPRKINQFIDPEREDER